MNQVIHDQICDKVNRLQTLVVFIGDYILRNNCEKKLKKITRLLDDEYRKLLSLKHIILILFHHLSI